MTPDISRLTAGFFLFFFLTVLAASAQAPRNAMIIGIDGLRGDAFMAASTPNMDQFMNAGDYTYDCDAGAKTECGPSWASVLTGVWHKTHNVTSDEFKKPALDLYPHFFKGMQETAYRTASVVNLPAIQEHIDCCSRIPLIGKTDEMVKSKTIELIKNDHADVFFLQFNDVNEAGSLSAYSASEQLYIKAIERMDKAFGELLEQIQAQATDQQEEWLIMICTDHGGEENEHDGKQKVREVRMVPQIMGLCGTDGKIGLNLDGYLVGINEASNVNIVPTVLEYLSLPFPVYLEGSSYIIPAVSTEW